MILGSLASNSRLGKSCLSTPSLSNECAERQPHYDAANSDAHPCLGSDSGAPAHRDSAHSILAFESGRQADASTIPPPPLSLDAMFPGLRAALGNSLLDQYSFVQRRSYKMKCNWKVFADNYLDGGYHIAQLHPGLASQLDLRSYRTELHPFHSIQTCDTPPPSGRSELAGNEVPDRVGPPVYAWLFPTTAINKYGPWIDVHTVSPLGPAECVVTFDYFLLQSIRASLTEDRLMAQLRASIDVQNEDIAICESVQQGLSSGGYNPGRYAGPERASHHFHTLLASYL